MQSYQIWYQKDNEIPETESYFTPRPLNRETMDKTHAIVAEIEAEDLEDVFFRMNDPFGEGYNPLSTLEGQNKLRNLGVRHTSMSVNDAVMINGEIWQVLAVGWEKR